MEILILVRPYGTHADVCPAGEHASVPAGHQAAVIAPGEAYRGTPYETWRAFLGREVDLLSLQAGSPPPGRAKPLAAWEPPNAAEVELPVTAVLDGAFQLVRRGGVPLVAVAAVLALPQAAGAAAIRAGVETMGAGLALTAFLVAWGFAAQAMLIVMLSECYHGRRAAAGRAALVTARRLGGILALSVLGTIAVTFSLLLLIVPGLVVFCRLYVAPAALMLEKRNAWEALGRSWTLVRGATGRVFVMVFLLYVLGWLLSSSVAGMERVGGMVGLLASVFGLTVAVFTTVIGAAVTVALFYGLRVAKEAYDVTLAAEALGEPPPAPAPA